MPLITASPPWDFPQVYFAIRNSFLNQYDQLDSKFLRSYTFCSESPVIGGHDIFAKFKQLHILLRIDRYRQTALYHVVTYRQALVNYLNIMPSTVLLDIPMLTGLLPGIA